MKNKILLTVMLVAVLFAFTTSTVYASTFLDRIMAQGNKFDEMGTDSELGELIAEFIMDDLKPVVEFIGNLIFAAITVILGAKFIWSGVEGKSQVKETLPTFVAAVIFFYLATELVDLFNPLKAGTIGSDLSGAGGWLSLGLAGMIIGTINTIVTYASIGGIVFIGLKYMFASAEGKASIKDRLTPMILGVILVFCASTVVDFIINSSKQLLR